MNSFYTDINDNDGVEILQEEEEEDIETIVSSTSEQRQQRDDNDDFVITQTISFACDGQREDVILINEEDSDCSSTASSSNSSVDSEHSTISRFHSPRSKKRKISLTAPFTPPSTAAREIFRRSSSSKTSSAAASSLSSSTSLLSPPLLFQQRSNSSYNSQKRICLFEEHNTKNDKGEIDLSFLAFPSLANHGGPSSSSSRKSQARNETPRSPVISSTPKPRIPYLSPRTTLAPRFHDIPELELMRENSLFSSSKSEDEESEDDWNTSSSRPSTPPALTACFSFDGDHHDDGNLHSQLNQSPAFDDDEEEEEHQDFLSPFRMKRRRTPLAPTKAPRATTVSPIRRNPFLVPKKQLFPSTLSLQARMSTMQASSPLSSSSPPCRSFTLPPSLHMRPAPPRSHKSNTVNNGKLMIYLSSSSSSSSAPFLPSANAA